jgi:hypothetical protein
MLSLALRHGNIDAIDDGYEVMGVKNVACHYHHMALRMVVMCAAYRAKTVRMGRNEIAKESKRRGNGHGKRRTLAYKMLCMYVTIAS